MFAKRLSSDLRDTPVDFESFVARQRGLPSEQAARLIMEWMESYEAPRDRRHGTEPRPAHAQCG